jgi:hypothetical protein
VLGDERGCRVHARASLGTANILPLMYLVYTLHYLKIARFAETCHNGYEILKMIKMQLLLMGYFSVVFMLSQRDVGRKEKSVPSVKIVARFPGCAAYNLLVVLT